MFSCEEIYVFIGLHITLYSESTAVSGRSELCCIALVKDKQLKAELAGVWDLVCQRMQW